MILTTPDELAGLEHANAETLRLLRDLEARATAGVRTADLDAFARERIATLGGEAAFETQNGFPGAINTNPNDIVVHGVPGEYRLQAGDILTIDVGMMLDGFAGDAATTFTIGKASPRQAKLIATTRRAMEGAIRAARVGGRVGDVSWAMQSVAEAGGYTVAREFCGHGLGRRLWEPPQVPFAGQAGTGPTLREGMVITIEPVVIEGTQGFFMANRWEAKTRDQSLVAQFERAVVVTKAGGVVLGEGRSPRLPLR